jgi:hypothetical protein
VLLQPPPPPVVVAPPPPPPAAPAPRTRQHVKHRPVRHKKRVVVAHPRRPAKKSAAKREPLVTAVAPVSSSPGSSSPAPLMIGFGVLLALLAVGISFMPASAMPVTVGLRLERNRQTIALTGLAIGVACALVGLLTSVAAQ